MLKDLCVPTYFTADLGDRINEGGEPKHCVDKFFEKLKY